MENVVKECEEEASIPPELAVHAKPVGAVSYTSLQPAGLKRDVLFCFDLELPVDFVPQPLVSTSWGGASSPGKFGGLCGGPSRGRTVPSCCPAIHRRRAVTVLH